MPNLTFNQKTVLNLYNMFFGEAYPRNLSSDAATKVHINAQKMCYLLKMDGIDVGDFSYSWNFHGPFSPGLLALLRGLDAHAEEVSAFYMDCDQPFTQEDQDRITSLISNLHLNTHNEDRSNWMELLGSLAFLSHSVLPGEDFTCISHELKCRKPQFSDDEMNLAAWNVLKDARLLKTW